VTPLPRQVALLVALALVPAIGQGLYLREKISWLAPVAERDEITVEGARALGDRAIWVDARPEDEFEREHVPGALLLNEDRWNELLPRMLETWSPEKRVVVYCNSKSCGASREVARRLRTQAGLTNVFVLKGGWEAWLQRR
jgi:rhodanese-related sulfurtransferase